MKVVEINNYDVLLPRSDRAKESVNQAPPWNMHEGHVGNGRFNVFVNMNAKAYSTAEKESNQEEMDRIAQSIVDTICHKCVPNGRFLEYASSSEQVHPDVNDEAESKSSADRSVVLLSCSKSGGQNESEWYDLGDAELAKLRTKQALSEAAKKLENSFNLVEVSPKSTASRGVRFRDGQCCDDEAEIQERDSKIPRRGILRNKHVSPSLVNLSDDGFQASGDEEEGMSSSISRRTSSIIMSAFAAATGFLDSIGECECRECGCSSEGSCSAKETGVKAVAAEQCCKHLGKRKRRSLRPPVFVKEDEISNFDVMCSSRPGEGMLLNSTAVGNNRLRVLISIHRDKYARTDRSGKCRIVCQIMKTMKSCNPPARFLVKESVESEKLRVLDRRESFMATVRTIRAMDPDLERLRSDAVEGLKKRKEKADALSKLGKVQQ